MGFTSLARPSDQRPRNLLISVTPVLELKVCHLPVSKKTLKVLVRTFESIPLKKECLRAGETSQSVKCSLSKPEDLSLISSTCVGSQSHPGKSADWVSTSGTIL